MSPRNTPLYLSASLLLLLLLITPPTLATSSSPLNLFTLQPISSFPPSCTEAYSGDISDCSSAEVTTTGRISSEGRGVCSLQCIAALSTVNDNINRACGGIQANPATLIGMFFTERALAYLCPNSVEGRGPPPRSTAAPSSSLITPTLTSTSPSPSATESETESETETDKPETSPETSPESESETSPPPSPKPTPTFQPTTAVNNGVATVLTSEAQRSDSAKTNPEAFGGGGSPFEVAANAASSHFCGFGAGLSTLVFWVVVSLSWS